MRRYVDIEVDKDYDCWQRGGGQRAEAEAGGGGVVVWKF